MYQDPDSCENRWQLSYCITQYLEKDPKLADIILRGLIKYWPHTNSSKEVMFLNELEELLELTQSPDFAKVAEPLFRLIARCINSPHFQVAERALFLWNNEYIVSLIAKSRDVILPVLYPALEANTTKHWNSTVHGLTFNVQKLFMDMDARLWEDCTQRHKLNMERCSSICMSDVCVCMHAKPPVPSLLTLGRGEGGCGEC
jgi:serine/threonine-protein phosphatase 2A regulatory subunit B'